MDKYSLFPKWFSPKLIKLIKRKKLAHRRYKRNDSFEDYLLFSFSRSECKVLSKESYNEFIRNTEETISNNNDVKPFWSYVNSRRKAFSLPNEMHYNDSKASDWQAIADIFASYFDSLYSSQSVESPEFDFDHSTNLSKIRISIGGVFSKLSNLHPFKGLS